LVWLLKVSCGELWVVLKGLVQQVARLLKDKTNDRKSKLMKV